MHAEAPGSAIGQKGVGRRFVSGSVRFSVFVPLPILASELGQPVRQQPLNS